MNMNKQTILNQSSDMEFFTFQMAHVVRFLTKGFMRRALSRFAHVPHNPTRCLSIRVMQHKIGLSGYVLLIIPVTAFALGSWQVKRRKWKLNLIEQLRSRLCAQPVALPDDLDEVQEMQYCRVHVQGYFDHTKELYVTPRSLIEPGKEGRREGLASDPRKIGFYVITPFHLTDRNVCILVKRGWVPKNKLNPQMRPDGQIDGEIHFVGVLRKSEKRQPFMQRNDPNSNFLYYLDVDDIASRVDASPVLIDADYDSTVPGGPIGGQTRVELRNEHFSYIVTWYSLSAATFYLWYRKVFVRKPLL